MPYSASMASSRAVLGGRAAAAPRLRVSARRSSVRPVAVMAPERGIPDAYKSPSGAGYDLVAITRDAYLAFNTGGEQGLPLDVFWAEDATFKPQYPVPGWQPAYGRQAILAQFGSFSKYETLSRVGVESCEFVRAGNQVFVYEHMKFDGLEGRDFTGMAVHTMNDEGQCIKSEAWHDPRSQDYSSIRAKAICAKAYQIFADGDFEGLAAMHSPDFVATWNGPEGRKQYGSVLEVAAVIGESWANFRHEPALPLEMLYVEGGRVLCKVHAVTDNGMDLCNAHLWEVDLEAGTMKSAYFFDDSLGFFNAKLF